MITKQGTFAKAKKFINWATGVAKVAIELLDKIKIAIYLSIPIMGTFHLKTCSDKAKVETQLTTVTAAKTKDSVKLKACSDTITTIKHLKK